MYLCPNFEPVFCSLSTSNCCFLTCIPVSQKAGKVVWYSHHLRILQFPVIHTGKDFCIVIEVVFLELSCFVYDPMEITNLISDSSAFSEPSLYILKFSFQILLKHSLKHFEHSLACMWNEHNYMIVWTFVGIAHLWDWNESLPFPVLCPLLSGPNLLAYWVQYFNNIIV